MKLRLTLLCVIGSSIATYSHSDNLPRTQWGHPDLSGVWSNETLTPFERPTQAAEFVSESEAKQARTRIRDARSNDAKTRKDITPPPKGGSVGGYNLVWLDFGDNVIDSGRSSLVLSNDGRVPIRPTALANKAIYENRAVADMEFMSPWDRCITRGIPGGMFQAGYNNYYRIEQRPTQVLIYYEMIHEARIIPIDATPRLAGDLQFWNGEPRGHWDGDTLVVRSQGFKPGWIATSFSQGRVKGIASTKDLKIEERFTRSDDKTIVWRVTVDDPTIYSTPWTVEVPMVNRGKTKVFEYACHEGNQAIRNILKGARVVEADTGSIEHHHPSFANLVDQDSEIEKIADGFEFIEGPVWFNNQLYFSDIPGDRVYSWSQAQGVKTRIEPVFLPELQSRGMGGSNGLALDQEGNLLLAEHGNRRIARLRANGKRETVADRYQTGRLNSPNDMVLHSSGSLFFTDPPYGLEGLEQSADKEQAHNGIYRLDSDGSVTLLATQTRPNGIGLSPDEKTLYVANSDQPPNRYWMAYEVTQDLQLQHGRIWFDANHTRKEGVPDGLAVDRDGNVWATGPGGVWVISPQATLLGIIAPPERPANAAFGENGQTLFMTARSGLYRIRVNARGLLPR
ncbi:MAG: gluconolactonase [Limisphaerales bacterium]|jgi:gluconolactonase